MGAVKEWAMQIAEELAEEMKKRHPEISGKLIEDGAFDAVVFPSAVEGEETIFDQPWVKEWLTERRKRKS
jgi:hypothetical protein